MVEIDVVYRAMCMTCGAMKSVSDRRIAEEWADSHVQQCGKRQSYSVNVFDNNDNRKPQNDLAVDPHRAREERRIQ